MSRHSAWLVAGLSLFAIAAAAQQRPIFDPDDFVDPTQHDGPVFASRIVLGVARSFIDDYRPLAQDVGFVHITNTLYRKNWQFDYKHTEVRGENAPPDVVRCGCSPPVYFPTPPPSNATPAPPRPGSKETLQVGFYWSLPRDAAPPLTLRYRVSVSRQPVDTDVRSLTTGEIVEHHSGHEQSIGLEGDVHFLFRGREWWGTLLYAHTSLSGTIDIHNQQELAYESRFPAWVIRQVFVRPTLTIGGVSNRGGTAINVFNPALEVFWHNHLTRGNIHFVWSPQSVRSGLEGWQVHQQIALFVDYAPFVKLFP
jgi:hypothetical protein